MGFTIVLGLVSKSREWDRNSYPVGHKVLRRKVIVENKIDAKKENTVKITEPECGPSWKPVSQERSHRKAVKDKLRDKITPTHMSHSQSSLRRSGGSSG